MVSYLYILECDVTVLRDLNLFEEEMVDIIQATVKEGTSEEIQSLKMEINDVIHDVIMDLQQVLYIFDNVYICLVLEILYMSYVHTGY